MKSTTLTCIELIHKEFPMMLRVISRFFLLGLISVVAAAAAFSQSVTFTPSYSYYLGSLHADFNSDGREDFVIEHVASGCPQFGLVLSTGNGTYAARVCYTTPSGEAGPIAIGDFNGDGYPDVIIGDGISTKFYEYLGSHTGALHLQATFVTPTVPVAFAAADVNHDGKIDLLYSDCNYCSTSDLHVWFGNGNGGFTIGPTTTMSSNATSLTVGDFDGDGHVDILTQQALGASQQTTALVFYGDGTGHFTAGTQIVGSGPYLFHGYDVNGDGQMDLIAAPFNGGQSTTPYLNYLQVYYGESNRTFTAAVIPLANCQTGTSPTVADFNGDGINDIIVVEAADCRGSIPDTVNVLLGNSNGTFQPEQVVFNGNPNLFDVIALRGNQDSKADFMLRQSSKNFDAPGYIFQNTTAGKFPPCNAPNSYTGITLCSPTSTVVGSSPVAFKIGAANQTQARKLEVWVDGKKLGENLKDAFSYYSFFNTSYALANGTHQVTVYSAGWDNLLEKFSFPLTVGGLTCAPPASAGLNVCSPISNSTDGSSVLAWAGGKVTGTIARMEVWVDGVKKYSTYGSNTLKTNVSLASGSHRFTYYIVNTAGQKWSQVVYATVP